MKKKYYNPEIEIIDLEDVDIITTSGVDGVGGSTDPSSGDNNDQMFE